MTYSDNNYIAPVTEVIDISSGAVYCASGNTENYNVNNVTDLWSENEL